jgi:SAM-dependent methyltransferase
VWETCWRPAENSDDDPASGGRDRALAQFTFPENSKRGLKEMNKDGVEQFNEDIVSHGSYVYNNGHLSSEFASERTNREIEKNYSFEGKKILDLGCGDGRYSFYLASNLPVEYVVGVDPAEIVIEKNRRKLETENRHNDCQQGKIRFQVGDIYNLNMHEHFDCVIMRWMMHHLPDPALAIEKVASLTDTLIIVDSNGWNPVLKFLEHFSPDHIEHGEKSFILGNVVKWIQKTGFTIKYSRYINLVPMFCPDWMARICKTCEPIVEMLPMVRNICCGQFIIVAQNIPQR